MASHPTPKLSLEAQARVTRNGHCPYLAERVEASQYRQPHRTFEQVQEIIRDKGWD